jgi:hypothetical protein
VIFNDTVTSNQHSAIVLQLGVQSFDLPTVLVSSQVAPILRGGFHPVRSVRSDQSNPNCSQLLIQWVTFVGSIADQPLRGFRDKSRCESCYFKRRSRRNADGDRNAMAVYHVMTFVPFPAWSFRLPAPFFATTKKPWMKHSDRSRSSLSFKLFASACRIFSSTPALRHSWKQRWQIAGEGYRWQVLPRSAGTKHPQDASQYFLIVYSWAPFTVSLGSFSDIKGSRIAHCSSAKSIGHAPFGSMTYSNHF